MLEPIADRGRVVLYIDDQLPPFHGISPSFGGDPRLHGGGLTLRRDDAMWLANALLLALGRRKHFTYARNSKDPRDPPGKSPRPAGGR